MDGLLEELRSQGQVDSSGRFTLDLSRMLPLLARYQLPRNLIRMSADETPPVGAVAGA